MPRLVLTILLSIAPVFAACGGVDRATPPPAATRLARAEDATTALGSLRTAVVATTSLPEGGGLGGFVGEGVFDVRSRRGRSTLHLSQGSSPGVAALDDPVVEVVVDGGAVYVRSPLNHLLGAIDTPWLRIDESAAEDLASAGSYPLRLPGDPLATPLALLGRIDPATVLDLGSADVGGVVTTHLRATIVVGRPPAGEDSHPWSSPAELGTDRLEVDAFLDDDDRVRRLVYELPLDGPGGGYQRIELEHSHFGARVQVQVPAAEEITDLADVVGR
ncbi:MAG: hypothetical protein KY450_10140 [Actinobacteria bacterium]|nr:hypothetical protein [Actinomycetota bacterium]